MNIYKVHIKETVYTTLYNVLAESEEDAKIKVENGDAIYDYRKDTDSCDLLVESIELA